MNIRLGRPDHPAADEDLTPSVDYAAAGPVIAKLPDGLRSLLARMFRGAVELSGGEWQKVGRARTHWRSSTSQADGVLIVDEPTTVYWTGPILDEARATADPVHLMTLFGITEETAMDYLASAHPEKFPTDPIGP